MTKTALQWWGAFVVFAALTAGGIMIFGVIIQFVLGLFGIGVTFVQSCGFGFVLGLIFGQMSR